MVWPLLAWPYPAPIGSTCSCPPTIWKRKALMGRPHCAAHEIPHFRNVGDEGAPPQRVELPQGGQPSDVRD
jgi:hypothetical protein